PGRPRRFDVDCGPWRTKTICKPTRIANQRYASRSVIDRNQYAVAGGPRSFNGMSAHMAEELLIHALCSAAQRQLTQCREISRRKIVADRPFCGLREIDLAFIEALDEIVWREIDEFDIVSTVDDAVWH